MVTIDIRMGQWERGLEYSRNLRIFEKTKQKKKPGGTVKQIKRLKTFCFGKQKHCWGNSYFGKKQGYIMGKLEKEFC